MANKKLISGKLTYEQWCLITNIIHEVFIDTDFDGDGLKEYRLTCSEGLFEKYTELFDTIVKMEIEKWDEINDVGNGNDYIEMWEYDRLDILKQQKYTHCSHCHTYFNHVTGDYCGCGKTKKEK